MAAFCPALLFILAIWTATTAVGASPPPNWPNGPFVTSGQWIFDASGGNVTYAGVNWPGAGETMLPEGLQYQSIEAIVSKIKGIGMNAIRLTYAIQMIDEIYDNGGRDVRLQTTLTNALGNVNGTKVLSQIMARNPQFSGDTTRLQVFDAVASECAKQGIYVHLDNHVSKAMWCCSDTDGNAFWGDTYFDAVNWTRGISYMAKHGRAWPGLVSMSLRNEPREPSGNTAAEKEYSWQSWYKYVKQGASAIHASNPSVLVFLSGLSYDTYITPVVRGTALTPGTDTFDLTDFEGYADKIVLELHNYQNSATSCSSLQETLNDDGFEAMLPTAAHRFPVVMTEFGFAMDATTYRGVYATCLASYLPLLKAGWMIWVLSGSYYVRSGVQDFDETWALLNHDWTDWRNPDYVRSQLIPMINATIAY